MSKEDPKTPPTKPTREFVREVGSNEGAVVDPVTGAYQKATYPTRNGNIREDR